MQVPVWITYQEARTTLAYQRKLCRDARLAVPDPDHRLHRASASETSALMALPTRTAGCGNGRHAELARWAASSGTRLAALQARIVAVLGG